ncbi:MAG TPA: septum formation initiator family protein [Patescibacteria group bacterium]
MYLKKIVFFSIIIISLFIINSFLNSIYSLWQKNDLVVKARQDLEKEKKENGALKSKLSEVKNPQFVEEEARDKLFLAKPGETIVFLPAASKDLASQNVKKQDSRPNWRKWWDVFF